MVVQTPYLLAFLLLTAAVILFIAWRKRQGAALGHQTKRVANPVDHLRELMDRAPVCVIELSREGECLHLNPACLNVLGLTPKGNRRIFFTDLVHPDDKGDIESLLEFRTQPPDEGGQLEFRLKQDDRWVAAHWLRRDDPDSGGSTMILVDITRRRSHEQKLWTQAHYDDLTGLPNRAMLNERIQWSLAHSRRAENTFALCLLDLDGFKPVNDTLGHEAGDLLLKELAVRLLATVRGDDTVVRYGGDEFILLINDLMDDKECEFVFNRILGVIAEPFIIDGINVEVTASLGVTLFPGDDAEAEQLLRHADQAMYKAKEKGKNDFHLFDPTLESKRRAHQKILQRIEHALSAGQFELHYQPIVDCYNGTVTGAEVLIRWNHPVMGLLSPAEFLPLIESDDLIIRLSDWVMETALDQAYQWRKMGMDLGISINASSRYLLKGGLYKRLEQLVTRYPAELISRIELEILETAALEDVQIVGDLIGSYHKQGVSFALDDFGTGFSSLSHLKHLAVNTLKIDRSFVADMLTDPGDMAIVQGILGLADAFNTRVVAEGVENIDQLIQLLHMGCNTMQGFGIAKPMTAQNFFGWHSEFNKDPLWSVAHDRYPSREYFKVLLMEVTHRNWLEKIKRIYFNRPEKREPPVPFEQCRLTAWYKDKGLQLYSEIPEFMALDILHRKVHHLGAILYEALDKGQDEKAGKLFEELSVQSASFIQAFQQFRAKLIAHGPKERTAIQRSKHVHHTTPNLG